MDCFGRQASARSPISDQCQSWAQVRHCLIVSVTAFESRILVDTVGHRREQLGTVPMQLTLMFALSTYLIVQCLIAQPFDYLRTE